MRRRLLFNQTDHPHPWKRRQRRLIITLMCLTSLGIALLSGLQWTAQRADSALEHKLDKLVQKGFSVHAPRNVRKESPKTPEPTPPADPNDIPFDSFAVQVQSLADISEYTECLCTKELPAWNTMSDPVRAAMRKYLADNQKTLKILHDNALRLYAAITWNTEIDDWNLTKTHFDNLSKAIRLLQIEAHVALADGDPVFAAFALEAAMTLVKQSAALSETQRVGKQAVFASTLAASIRTVLNDDGLTPDSLAHLQDAIAALHTDKLLRREMQCQLNWGQYFFDNPNELTNYFGTHPLDQWIPGITNVALESLQIVGWNSIQHEKYIDFMARLTDIADLPAPQRFDGIRTLDVELGDSFLADYKLSHAFAWHASAAIANAAQLESEWNFAQTAIAIDRFRRDHGALPESLDTLAPNYLNAPPRDVYDAKPLRYRPGPRGFTLYSIGLDGVDHGGRTSERDEAYWNWAGESDVGFTVAYPHDLPTAQNPRE